MQRYAYLWNNEATELPLEGTFEMRGQVMAVEIISSLSEREQAQFNVFPIIEPPEPELGFVVAITGALIVEGFEVSRGYQMVPEPPTVRRERRLAELTDIYAGQLQSPFAWDFGALAAKDDLENDAGPAGVQTLQMRVDPSNGVDDVKNWLGAGTGALAAQLAGAGALPSPIKVTSNVWVQTTAAHVVQVLITGDGVQASMLSRQQQILARFGQLKKLIEQAADPYTVDITTGWPG